MKQSKKQVEVAKYSDDEDDQPRKPQRDKVSAVQSSSKSRPSANGSKPTLEKSTAEKKSPSKPAIQQKPKKKTHDSDSDELTSSEDESPRKHPSKSNTSSKSSGSKSSSKQTNAKPQKKEVAKKAPEKRQEPTKQESKKKEVTPDNSDDDDPDAPVTKEWLERALIKRVKEFSDFVKSITLDLEEQEEEFFKELAAKNEALPESLWANASFKIDLTKGLLLTMFKPERLMKYYVVYLLGMKKWIVKRKDTFFLKADLFPGAKAEYIVFFRNLWAIDGTMSEDEKRKAWEYLDTFVAIVEDWKELTGWEPTPDERLLLPEKDFDQAAKELGIDSDEDSR